MAQSGSPEPRYVPATFADRVTGAWLDVVHPHEGRLRQLRPPVRMGDTPTSVRRPAPRLGEHTDEVLAELAAGR